MAIFSKKDYKEMKVKSENAARDILNGIKNYDVDKKGFKRLKPLLTRLDAKIEFIQYCEMELKNGN